jgi:hypothetical protein
MIFAPIEAVLVPGAVGHSVFERSRLISQGIRLKLFFLMALSMAPGVALLAYRGFFGQGQSLLVYLGLAIPIGAFLSALSTLFLVAIYKSRDLSFQRE